MTRLKTTAKIESITARRDCKRAEAKEKNSIRDNGWTDKKDELRDYNWSAGTKEKGKGKKKAVEEQGEKGKGNRKRKSKGKETAKGTGKGKVKGAGGAADPDFKAPEGSDNDVISRDTNKFKSAKASGAGGGKGKGGESKGGNKNENEDEEINSTEFSSEAKAAVLKGVFSSPETFKKWKKNKQGVSKDLVANAEAPDVSSNTAINYVGGTLRIFRTCVNLEKQWNQEEKKYSEGTT